jgi:hypothetical protein
VQARPAPFGYLLNDFIIAFLKIGPKIYSSGKPNNPGNHKTTKPFLDGLVCPADVKISDDK